MTQLEIRQAGVAYGRQEVVKGVSFTLEPGDIGCLLGPSGCGKTSLLRAIAGFEPLRSGEIALRGQRVSAPGFQLPPEARRVGMVFQDFALFPHLTIGDNIAFGLRDLPARERGQRVLELLKLVDMDGLRDVYPHQISGGQQQRVALIRAIAPRPDLLLLDEPFSSLDVELREQLAREVREVLKQGGITAILVTHDQLEAFAMADVIGVMHQGRLAQWDSAYQLYHEPKDRFVADFVGQGVFLQGRVVGDNLSETPFGVIHGIARGDCCSDGESVEILLRPDDVVHDDASDMLAEVVGKAFRGAEYLYTLRLAGGEEILCMVQSHHNHGIGEQIGIRLDVQHLVMFPKT
jgi:iron(III) transport system ATP-binding protein